MRLVYPTLIKVILSPSQGEFGQEIPGKTIITTCKFVETTDTKRGPDGAFVNLTAYCKIAGDLAPTSKFITGSCIINKMEYKIMSAMRKRDLKDRVTKTVLELI